MGPKKGGRWIIFSQMLFTILRKGVLAFYFAKLGQATRRSGGAGGSYKR